LDIQNPDLHIALGIALGSKEDTDRAIAEFREALRLNLDNEFAHYDLGNALTL